MALYTRYTPGDPEKGIESVKVEQIDEHGHHFFDPETGKHENTEWLTDEELAKLEIQEATFARATKIEEAKLVLEEPRKGETVEEIAAETDSKLAAMQTLLELK
jgi:hypothetical protein